MAVSPRNRGTRASVIVPASLSVVGPPEVSCELTVKADVMVMLSVPLSPELLSPIVLYRVEVIEPVSVSLAWSLPVS